jgi:hypothetical protein
MKVIVYVWKIKSDQERELLNNIISKTLSETTFELHELQVNPEVYKTTEDLVLCFGIRSYQLVSQVNPGSIKLPTLTDLIDKPANTNSRIEAWEILKRVNNPVAITEQDSLLHLSSDDLKVKLQDKNLTLLKDTEDNLTDYWMGETLSGKKVLISSKLKSNTIQCDFQITTEELYAAKLAIEVLGLKSLVIVRKDKKDE